MCPAQTSFLPPFFYQWLGTASKDRTCAVGTWGLPRRQEWVGGEKPSDILGKVPIMWTRDEEGKMLDAQQVCWFVESKMPDVVHGKVWLDAEYGGELELENC